MEDSDSGGAGLEDALEQTSERHGSGGMPAVELLREGRELFVQARHALQPTTPHTFRSPICGVELEQLHTGLVVTDKWRVLDGMRLPPRHFALCWKHVVPCKAAFLPCMA